MKQLHAAERRSRLAAMKSAQQDLILYIAKCLSGCVILFAFGAAMPLIDISWVLISMLLVLSPDNNEVIPLTVVRIKANLVASAVTMAMLLLATNPLIAICAAIIVTIVLCYLLNLMAGSRPALAAAVIIALHPAGAHLWSTAVERLASVVSGCLLGLILTFAFHRRIRFGHRMKEDRGSE